MTGLDPILDDIRHDEKIGGETIPMSFVLQMVGVKVVGNDVNVHGRQRRERMATNADRFESHLLAVSAKSPKAHAINCWLGCVSIRDQQSVRSKKKNKKNIYKKKRRR